jgi:hypothetical protein
MKPVMHMLRKREEGHTNGLDNTDVVVVGLQTHEVFT